MKTGIITVFHNYERQLNKAVFIKQIQELEDTQICLVNNESKDNTYELLKDIKESCSNVSVVNIKKFKSDVVAVKAGARYLFSQKKLKRLGYINTNLIHNSIGIHYYFDQLITHKNQIFDVDEYKYLTQQRLFKSSFSIIESINKLKFTSS